jgi:hypothetical protein
MENQTSFSRISRKARSVVTPLFFMFLASCITPGNPTWLDEIPPQSLFVRAYQADPQNQQLQSQQEYLDWILGFYQGTLLYPTGWLDIESALLDRTAPDTLDSLDSRLEQLGFAIGSELAKENDVRLIDNRMLALWGSTLQLAYGAGAQQQAIELIGSDIDKILSGTLAKEDIVESRYADSLGLEVFGGF